MFNKRGTIIEPCGMPVPFGSTDEHLSYICTYYSRIV